MVNEKINLQKNGCISVIVPIYNKQRYLARCIDSIIEQDYTNIEIILVNDGSTDNSLKLCEEYKKKDNRIKIIDKLNGGVSSARNSGISVSKGEFLAFVDPDDSIEKTMFTELSNALNTENGDIAYCHAIDVYPNNTFIKKSCSNQLYKFKAIDYDWLDSKAHAVCWGALYRRSVIKNVRFNEELSIGEDTLFFAQCVKNSRYILCLDKSLYRYQLNDDSVTSGVWSSKKNDEFKARKIIAVLIPKKSRFKLSANAGCGYIILNIIRKYCLDQKFINEECNNYRKLYSRYFKSLLRYYIYTLKIGGCTKAVYALMFWQNYIKHQQRKLTNKESK